MTINTKLVAGCGLGGCLSTSPSQLRSEVSHEMKFWQRRKEGKLYKQWAEHAGLPPAAKPPSDTPAETKTGAGGESRSYRFRLKILDIVRKILGIK